MKSLLRHISDAGQDVSKPGARINAVQLCSLDQAIHGGGAFSALVGACEKPSLPPKGRAAQHALGSVIRQANAAIVQKSRESPPALQHVVHGLGKVIVARELCPLGPHLTADNQAERAATIRMRKRHWGRTVGRA